MKMGFVALSLAFTSSAFANTSIFEGGASYWLANHTGNQGLVITGDAAAALKDKLVQEKKVPATVSCLRKDDQGQVICDVDFK